MVRCSHQDCPLGRWFHTTCMGLTDIPSTTDDWWCSTECQESGASSFCLCKTCKDEEMVTCASGENCKRGMYEMFKGKKYK